MCCVIDGQSVRGLRGVIVNQTMAYAWTTDDSPVLVYYIESDNSWGQYLRLMLTGKTWLNIDCLLDTEMLASIFPLTYKNIPNKISFQNINNVLDSVFHSVSTTNNGNPDARIRLVSDISLRKPEQAAGTKRYSFSDWTVSGTYTASFCKTNGYSFFAVCALERLRKTMQIAVDNQVRLLNVCRLYGFTDQPHFNRAFKRMLG